MVGQALGEPVQMTQSMPLSVTVGNVPSCGFELLETVCESDLEGDTCLATCEFGYEIEFTCVDTGTNLEWHSDVACVQGGDATTKRTM